VAVTRERGAELLSSARVLVVNLNRRLRAMQRSTASLHDPEMLIKRHRYCLCVALMSIVCIQVANAYLAADAEERKTVDMANRLKAAYTAAHEAHEHAGNPKKTQAWKEWCESIGEQVQDDSDDDLQVGEGAQFKNTKCVLTQKHIFDLKQPVEDSLKFIWEKEAIVAHIADAHRRNKACRNPAAHDTGITLQDLKPSRRVQRAAAKHHRQRAAEKQTEEIL
jgi:hypothetical protein